MTVAVATRAKGAKKTAARPNGVEAAFLAGRDLAVGMLTAAERLRNTDHASAKRRNRDGQAQHNFAKGFLLDLIARPDLLDGFSAVLSAALPEDLTVVAYYADLQMAEFLAGEVGADGTEAESGPSATDTASQADPAAAPNENNLGADQIYRCRTQLCRAQAALGLLSTAFGDEGLQDILNSTAMGTLQFARQELDRLYCSDVMEGDRSSNLMADLYWGVFHAYSLVTMVDDLESDDGYSWRLSRDLIRDSLEAAAACIASALMCLQGIEEQGSGQCVRHGGAG